MGSCGSEDVVFCYFLWGAYERSAWEGGTICVKPHPEAAEMPGSGEGPGEGFCVLSSTPSPGSRGKGTFNVSSILHPFSVFLSLKHMQMYTDMHCVQQQNNYFTSFLVLIAFITSAKQKPAHQHKLVWRKKKKNNNAVNNSKAVCWLWFLWFILHGEGWHCLYVFLWSASDRKPLVDAPWGYPGAAWSSALFIEHTDANSIVFVTLVACRDYTVKPPLYILATKYISIYPQYLRVPKHRTAMLSRYSSHRASQQWYPLVCGCTAVSIIRVCCSLTLGAKAGSWGSFLASLNELEKQEQLRMRKPVMEITHFEYFI